MRKQGFTLIEISIVLAIIGFIVGGILVGSSLINQAQLRSVISETNGFFQSITAFKLKFGYKPGDLPTASSYWPACDATPANCNGNGDNIIGYYSTVNQTTQCESYRAWQQLSLAGLIGGNFSGIATTAGQSDIGINVPASKYPGGGYSFIEYFSPTIYLSPGETMTFGGVSSGNVTGSMIISPQEAYTIDAKIDDGMARTGKVWGTSPSPGPASCITSYSSTGVYNVLLTTPLCAMHFLYQ
jgi:prepilin-type N-terminal cleavage/methylation domain-containing protein